MHWQALIVPIFGADITQAAWRGRSGRRLSARTRAIHRRADARRCAPPASPASPAAAPCPLPPPSPAACCVCSVACSARRRGTSRRLCRTAWSVRRRCRGTKFCLCCRALGMRSRRHPTHASSCNQPARGPRTRSSVTGLIRSQQARHVRRAGGKRGEAPVETGMDSASFGGSSPRTQQP
eukprot:COSAG01_NODE_66_length_29241_cov_17.772768_26_plen_180_part_00